MCVCVSIINEISVIYLYKCVDGRWVECLHVRHMHTHTHTCIVCYWNAIFGGEREQRVNDRITWPYKLLAKGCQVFDMSFNCCNCCRFAIVDDDVEISACNMELMANERFTVSQKYNRSTRHNIYQKGNRTHTTHSRREADLSTEQLNNNSSSNSDDSD